ncbi:unnamed protein product [Amoebophrya sp. A25]|nr:unnamed protein product [Amoebophrya sp. A25]|eukprot:GSA25T00027250001.1
MCMGLKQNLTLRVLDLQSNPVGSNGKHELETLMNATGREIVVQNYNVPAPTSPTTEWHELR